MTIEISRIRLGRFDLLRDQAFIGGKWIDAEDRLDVCNPATERLISTVPALGASEARAAVLAATVAGATWSAMTGQARGLLLRAWAQAMMEHQNDLARLLSSEQGKPLAEATSEVRYAASFLEWFGEEARRAYGEIIPSHLPDKRLSVLRQPVGVVAAITPWNFPLAMITRKAGPALAAGCTMVLKPSELTPLSALALALLSQEVGIPPGVFNVVTGPPGPIGDVLVEDERVAKFTFTGSTAVGKMLAARCAGTVKRVSLELGGNAPLIVFDDCDLDLAVSGAMAAKFRNAGQTCVCANRMLVQTGIYDAFATRLADRVRALRVGDAFDGEAPIGPLIDARAQMKASAHVADALRRGAHLLVGGSTIDGAGCFFQPTVLGEVPADALLCHEEIFAPIAGLVRFGGEADAVALANQTRSGLAAYLFTNDLSRSHRVSEALQCGMVGINTGLISTEVAPFGGVKESGIGREGSRHGLDDYLQMKLICTHVEPAAGGASLAG